MSGGYSLDLRGRCAKGERLGDRVPHGRWTASTFVAGMGSDVITAPRVVDRPQHASA